MQMTSMSSSALSRTSTRWVCTPAKASRWRRQTLTDSEYQVMRDQARMVMERVGSRRAARTCVRAPRDGARAGHRDESACRAAGVLQQAYPAPIAKIALKLAVGYRLHELPTISPLRRPPRSSSVIDYVVAKIPRWNMESSRMPTPRLHQMKSVAR